MVPWPSGLGGGLQNLLHWFKSSRDLKMGAMPKAGHLPCKENDWVRFPRGPQKEGYSSW